MSTPMTFSERSKLIQAINTPDIKAKRDELEKLKKDKEMLVIYAEQIKNHHERLHNLQKEKEAIQHLAEKCPTSHLKDPTLLLSKDNKVSVEAYEAALKLSNLETQYSEAEKFFKKLNLPEQTMEAIEKRMAELLPIIAKADEQIKALRR